MTLLLEPTLTGAGERYEVLETLSKGSHSAVYLADDKEARERVVRHFTHSIFAMLFCHQELKLHLQICCSSEHTWVYPDILCTGLAHVTCVTQCQCKRRLSSTSSASMLLTT